MSVGYDDAGNVISRTMHARPNMGPPIDESATYILPWELWSCHTECWRPLSSRDGPNRQTDYTYNSFGQLETQLDPPAVAGGVRRRTTIAYTESGVRRPREVRICGVGTTCGTNQEIVTQYEYFGDTPLVSLERRLDLATGATIDYGGDYGDSLLNPLIRFGPRLPGADVRR